MLRRIGFPLAALFLALLGIELVAFAAGRVLQGRGLMYRDPIRPSAHAAASYQEYLAKRDPLVGWPYPSQAGDDYFDATGARRNPAFEDPTAHPACLTLFGDSFTQGGQLGHEHVWSNLLSKQLGCRVANYGQGGYGSDQAYLRYTRQGGGPAQTVILGHLSENILRNVTRCRDIYISSMDYALKPRFVLDAGGRLELVPIPQLSEQEYRRMLALEGPALVLDHEFFSPGGPAGITPLRFPYLYSVLRNARDYRLRASIARRPPYAEFYDPDHAAGGLAITAGILRSFVHDVEAEGKKPLLLLFATRLDLEWHRKTGRWSYQTLVDRLTAEELPFIDFGPRLSAYLADREIDEIFDDTGHYDEEGNRFVADVLREYLTSQGLLEAVQARGE